MIWPRMTLSIVTSGLEMRRPSPHTSHTSNDSSTVKSLGDAEGKDVAVSIGDTEGKGVAASTGDAEGKDVAASIGDVEGKGVAASIGDAEGKEVAAGTGWHRQGSTSKKIELQVSEEMFPFRPSCSNSPQETVPKSTTSINKTSGAVTRLLGSQISQIGLLPVSVVVVGGLDDVGASVATDGSEEGMSVTADGSEEGSRVISPSFPSPGRTWT